MECLLKEPATQQKKCSGPLNGGYCNTSDHSIQLLRLFDNYLSPFTLLIWHAQALAFWPLILRVCDVRRPLPLAPPTANCIKLFSH